MREVGFNSRMVKRTISVVVASLLALFLLSGCVQFIPSQPQPSAELVAAEADLKKNDVEKAKERFETAINKDRANRFTYLYIMQYSLLTNHPDLVTEYFHRAETALNGVKGEDRARFYVLASVTLESAGNRQESIRACEQAYRLLPQDFEIQNALGYAYAQAGQNLERAVELTTSAVKAAREQRVPDKDVGAIVDSLGWAYYRNGQLAEAIRTLSSAADLAPDQSEIQYHLGMANFDSGKYKDAKIALTRARAVAFNKNIDPIALSKLQTAIDQLIKKVDEKLASSKPEHSPDSTGPQSP